MNLERITFSEIEENKEKVTAILFNKKGFDIEGMIRWLFDRKLVFETYKETNKFYIIEQPQRKDFKHFKYRVVDKNSIYAELGTDIVTQKIDVDDILET